MTFQRGKEAAKEPAQGCEVPRFGCQHTSVQELGWRNLFTLPVGHSKRYVSEQPKKVREEFLHGVGGHGVPSLCEDGGGELGEAAHLVQVHFLGHFLGVVDEVGAEECGQSQQAHGHDLGGFNGVGAFCIQHDDGKLLAL